MKRLVAILLTVLIFANTQAAIFAIDSANLNNGITDIYSTPFEGPPPLGGDPFFGVVLPLPSNRTLQVSPNPTGVVADVVPSGFTVPPFGFPQPPMFAYPPAAGSFLDLTLNAGNTMVTIAGGTITMPALGLTINQGQTGETVVLATSPGIVLNPIPVTVPIDGNGVAVFEVDPPSVGLAADFSNLAGIVGPTDCTGPLCAIIPVLTLDMLRYRLVVDFDPTFTSFTSDFVGQTPNFSMVFATLDSTVVPIPAAFWLFGSALGLLGWMKRKAS